MRLARVLCAALLVACGPKVLLPEDGDEADGSDTGGSPEETTSTTTTPVTATTSVGEVGEVGPPDPTIGESDVPTPPGLDCWRVDPLFEAPGDVGVFGTDQDGDGGDELWVYQNLDFGPGPGQINVFAVDESGVVLADTSFTGFLITVADVEGDGLRDLVAFTFDSGPSFGWSPAIGPFAFAMPPSRFDVDPGPGYAGFFDATADGRLDLFHDDFGTLTLFEGDGGGGFDPIGETAIGDLGSVAITPVVGGGDRAVLYTVQGFGGGPPEPCPDTDYRLLGTGAGLSVLAAKNDMAHVGRLLRAEAYFDTTLIYADACDGGEHGVMQYVHDGSGDVLTGSEVVAGVDWVAVGDFNGDALPDLLYSESAVELMLLAAGAEPLAFGDAEFTTVEGGEVPNNNVRTVDMDGDNVDELVRGVVIEEGDPPTLVYERVYLGPC